MVQVLSTTLPNGRKVHAQYDALRQAAAALYQAGRALGEVPTTRRGEAGRAAGLANQLARQRGDAAFLALDAAVEAMLNSVTEDTWDAALASLLPYKCGHCRERFATMPDLITHALEGTPVERLRPECAAALEAGLRLMAGWSVPTKTVDEMKAAGATGMAADGA